MKKDTKRGQIKMYILCGKDTENPIFVITEPLTVDVLWKYIEADDPEFAKWHQGDDFNQPFTRNSIMELLDNADWRDYMIMEIPTIKTLDNDVEFLAGFINAHHLATDIELAELIHSVGFRMVDHV